jgi:ubiquinone/menaquinone biosynthesis C-methylase UbiE
MIQMSHKFNLESKQKLDNPERRKLLPPEETLCRLGLDEGTVVADIGCGIGYFTLSAARIVGRQGKVFALDLLAEMLEIVKEKTIEHHLANVELVQVKENDFILAEKTIEYALACLVVHETENPMDFFREVYRILQPGGRLAIIEWTKQESKIGPPIDHRLDDTALEDLLHQCGYANTEKITLNSEMYGIIATI